MHYLSSARRKAENAFSQRNWEKMFEVAKKLDSPDFFLPNAEDAIDNDTRYHLKCWVTTQCKAQPTLCSVQELDDFSPVLANTEIVNVVDELLNTRNILNMNSINITYNNLLGKGKPENFKRYLKTLYEENVKNIVINQPSARNQPQRLFVQQLCSCS